MKDFLKECASYEGRWNRKKFWLYPIGASLVVLLPLTVLFGIAIATQIISLIWAAGALLWLGYIYIIYISICAYIKRFHDLDRSGHYTWIAFIPYIGIIAAIWGGFFKGTAGSNRFGADPLGWTTARSPIPQVNNSEEL